MTIMSRSYTIPSILMVLVILIMPDQAWAVQTHVAPEGLYVHQFAHVFYVVALGYLFWDLRRNTFNSKGWKLLQLFCVCMILWNVVAFAGHIFPELIAREDLIRTSGYLSTQLREPFTLVNLGFYLSKFDHLFSVPALLFLFLSLRALYRDSCEGEDK